MPEESQNIQYTLYSIYIILRIFVMNIRVHVLYWLHHTIFDRDNLDSLAQCICISVHTICQREGEGEGLLALFHYNYSRFG